MVSRVDLHLHSTASDGVLTPAQVVRKAGYLKLKYMALTDHDSIDGIAEALAEAENFPGLTVIPGVEMSTDVAAGDVHILGYFIDWQNPELKRRLTIMRASREDRGQAIVERLGELGMPLDWERVKEIAGEAVIGRPHIAQAMVEKGYISYIGEAFDKYISRGGPGYVERIKLAPAEAVALIRSVGGVPVMAHPLTLPGYEKLIEELIPAGLAGIEVFYSSFKDWEVERLKMLADRLGLVATGGTDYHGLDPATETMIGGQPVPLAAVEGLISRRQAG
ncbi:PHP domain-containing protein [Dehalogenimonas alkenigignens]|uniref:Putative metal-dependent phosphoesterases (PHP family) n=1 Tax=Dehalogenimonas alkenigignens TaxID=1217799 RepID=A0A0W0GGD9_9CHLR|nr:PHP domain-containing protein [Dehalogenimonas alkenigignens]KTB47632.1 putative metal-dependent phosphoesterases (PHP family) [Dehalogenimonas alkenigignens]PVV82830.1 PHP domain-containing protein [Dehalogenimonas alkenigignens]